jgi:hypothetical protein
VPPGLVALIARLLAYEPAERPRSALAVIKALGTALTLPRPPIRMIDMRPLATRAQRRRRITAVLVGVALALAFALEHDSAFDPSSPSPAPAAR